MVWHRGVCNNEYLEGGGLRDNVRSNKFKHILYYLATLWLATFLYDVCNNEYIGAVEL